MVMSYLGDQLKPIHLHILNNRNIHRSRCTEHSAATMVMIQ